jgi:hypothetical protein
VKPSETSPASRGLLLRARRSSGTPAFIALLTRDRSLMGKCATGRAWTVVIVAVTLMIAAATVVLGVVLVGG